MEFGLPDLDQKEFAMQTLERYAGCSSKDFQSKLLLTNFPQYVDHFAKVHNVKVSKGSMFQVAHCPKLGVSILDFKIGSPAAALVIQLCAFLEVRASILLGMCGGLRRRYNIGDYLVPVASIRNEGTSDYFLLPEIPALANFLMQRATTHVLDKKNIHYHIGITHTTNIRFWEYDKVFCEHLKKTKAQGIEMECATLFAAAYRLNMTLGALLLISDLPLDPKGMKTKELAEKNFEEHMKDHIELGIATLERACEMQDQRVAGSYDPSFACGLGSPKKPKRS